MSSHVPKQESAPAEAAAGADAGAAERRRITIRRAPKFVPFLLLGALLGLLAAGIVAFWGPANGDFSRSTVLGFFSMVFMVPGVLLGALAALVLDRFSVRRSKHAYVQASEEETKESSSNQHPAG